MYVEQGQSSYEVPQKPVEADHIQANLNELASEIRKTWDYLQTLITKWEEHTSFMIDNRDVFRGMRGSDATKSGAIPIRG